MDFIWWFFILLVAVVGILYQYSPSVRYVLKFYLYFLCIIYAGCIGALISLKNGRTPQNTLLMYKVYKKVCLWTGIKYETRDLKYLDTDEPCIVIANHQSALDVITMGYMWPQNTVVILKKSLKYLPGFNLCGYLCHSIWIDRINKEKAHKSLDDAMDHIKNKKHKVFIFPEGTRNSNDELLPFKKGAFILAKEANVPIIPVVFSRYKNFYNHDERRFDYGGHIIIKSLKPVYPQDFSTIEELSNECRKLMTAELDKLDKELIDKRTSSKKD
jgi:lysophosphatidate acyltransferase